MPEPARGRPRTEPVAQQRDRILRAARAAFTEHGYDDVTMAGVARQAGVTRAVLYEVVGSKEQLLAAVADEVTDELLERVERRFSRDDALARPLEEVVRDDIRWFVHLMASEPSFSAIIRQGLQMSQADEAIARARPRIEQRIAELHAARWEVAGLHRPATSRVLAAVILAMYETVALRVGEPDWPPGAVADLIGEFAVGGYLRLEAKGVAAAFEERIAEDPG